MGWDAEAERLKIVANAAYRQVERLEKELASAEEVRHVCNQTFWAARKRLRKLQERSQPPERLEKADLNYKQAVSRLRKAKRDCSALQAQVRGAKKDFKQASKPYKAKMEAIKAERARLDRDLAAELGVPVEYLNDLKVVRKVSGQIDIYFGGVDKPDGDGHGHVKKGVWGDDVFSRLPLHPQKGQDHALPA